MNIPCSTAVLFAVIVCDTREATRSVITPKDVVPRTKCTERFSD
jgi:hypothetical protein